jgi:hypothetical protein
MKATHWSAYNSPDEWGDNPQESPEKAVADLLADRDNEDSSDIMYDVAGDWRPVVKVRGYIETREPLPEAFQFDGYEEGQPYFWPTGETLEVRVRLSFDVLPGSDATPPAVPRLLAVPILQGPTIAPRLGGGA